MKERGKDLERFNNFSDHFNWPSSEISCKIHPYSSSVGICPHCLRERLMKLVCSECGEKRCSSCSCADIPSSYRNSCSKRDVGSVGSVGRMSFLIDNEKIDHKQRNRHSKSKRNGEKSEDVVFLKRSSSSCAEVKKSNGLSRIKRLFRKRRNKGHGENGEFSDENNEICVGVSRSRSLCSFRGLRYNDVDEGSDYGLSSAKISDVSSGIFFDSDKQYGFSYGYESRKKGTDPKRVGKGSWPNQMEIDGVRSFPNRSVFPVKEREFSVMDDSAFIELKLDSLSESKQDFTAGKINGAFDYANGYRNGSFKIGENLASLDREDIYGNGGSCRITTNGRGSKQGSRNYRVWKWIFKYHSAAKQEEFTF